MIDFYTFSCDFFFVHPKKVDDQNTRCLRILNKAYEQKRKEIENFRERHLKEVQKFADAKQAELRRM